MWSQNTFLTSEFDNEKLYLLTAGMSHFINAGAVFYPTTRIITLLGLFRVPTGSTAIAAIPIRRQSRSTPLSSMYRSQYLVFIQLI